MEYNKPLTVNLALPIPDSAARFKARVRPLILISPSAASIRLPQAKPIQRLRFHPYYGFRNVDHRIKMIFGERYGVRIYSRLGIGTAVQITVPLSEPL